VQSLKRTEQFAGVRHIKSDAVIAHKERGRAVAHPAAEFDMGMLFLRCVLPCVAKQIVERRTQETLVAFDSEILFDDDIHGAQWIPFSQILYHGMGESSQVNLSPVQGRAGHPRQLQHIVDKSTHFLSR